jgi:two-component system NtrC family response regulator
MTQRVPVLFAEDDVSLRRVAEYNLQNAGYDVSVASDGEEAWRRFQDRAAELVVTDLAMPGIDGFELLKRIKKQSPDTEVIIITAHGTVDRAVEAMKAGAFDFITKPFEFDVLRLTIERALERRHLRSENQRLQSELTDRFRPENIIGVSSAMQRVFDLIARVASVNTNVLILGESGTGKELIARAIHYHGARKGGPFVAVNCGALPHDLIESELFGVRRGAFTGAEIDRPGRFERANGGTLFLDEITDLPTDVQVKLLRALQEREIEHLGGGEPVSVDVRFVCASNSNIEQAVKEGSFRHDLYFRINVVAIHVPPLRERPEDIEPLMRAFLQRYGTNEVTLDTPVIGALKKYSWPGNVRELENAIERAIVLREHRDRITLADLPSEITAQVTPVGTQSGTEGVPSGLPENGIDFFSLEKSLLEQALARANGNRARAARLLGMTRQTLLYRLRKFGITTRQNEGRQ